MPFLIVRADITKINCDAIVNAANHTLLGGGGVDGAIHAAAGPALKEACRKLGGCNTGEAKLTDGFALPCKYIIHTVGPVWKGGLFGEETKLRACYRNSLMLAAQHELESVAFPLISAGVFGYPKTQALRIAREEIAAFLAEHDMTVFLVIYDRAVAAEDRAAFAPIQSLLDTMHEPPCKTHAPLKFDTVCDMQAMPSDFSVRESARPIPPAAAAATSASLEAQLLHLDESFSQMLLRKIDEKGMTDAQCYKRANVDRKLFSKIRNNPDYRPRKTTAIAFAIALELDLNETKDLLKKAGYALSHSNKFDVIIEYFILQQNYDIFEINEALFAFDQMLLGA